jgi:formyltetrahydrofolate deformylase
MKTAILVFQCLDKKGIISKIVNFISEQDANIIYADQHSTNPENGYFFIRIEFCFNKKDLTFSKLKKEFAPIASHFNAQWDIFNKNKRLKMGLLVSKPDHCLSDLLYRWKSNELNVDIPFVISNYDTHKDLLQQYGIPLYIIDVNNKITAEKEILKIAKQADFLVLARYMQILSPDFLKKYKKDIINIHHSFLPSFKGANPYLRAYKLGVKVIGATSHFVTENLDEGPIIEQIVDRVSHCDAVEDLKRKGKTLEQLALAQAIHLYLDYRITKYKNRTIVFHK